MVGAMTRWWWPFKRSTYRKERELVTWLLARGAHQVDLRRGDFRLRVDFISPGEYPVEYGEPSDPGGPPSKAKDAISGIDQAPDGAEESDGFTEGELYASSG